MDKRKICLIAYAFGVSYSSAYKISEEIGLSTMISAARRIVHEPVRPFWVKKTFKSTRKWLSCFGIMF